jgi:hypothetical protein
MRSSCCTCTTHTSCVTLSPMLHREQTKNTQLAHCCPTGQSQHTTQDSQPRLLPLHATCLTHARRTVGAAQQERRVCVTAPLPTRRHHTSHRADKRCMHTPHTRSSPVHALPCGPVPRHKPCTHAHPHTPPTHTDAAGARAATRSNRKHRPTTPTSWSSLMLRLLQVRGCRQARPPHRPRACTQSTSMLPCTAEGRHAPRPASAVVTVLLSQRRILCAGTGMLQQARKHGASGCVALHNAAARVVVHWGHSQLQMQP